MKLVSSKSGNYIAGNEAIDGVEAGVPFEVTQAQGEALIAKYGSLFSAPQVKAAPRPANKMAGRPGNK